jgi:hypothetical protein
MRISYGKFLQLLEGDRIKRVVVFGDMKTAVVEVGWGWRGEAQGRQHYVRGAKRGEEGAVGITSRGKAALCTGCKEG